MYETRLVGEIIAAFRNESPKYKQVKSATIKVRLNPFSRVIAEGLKAKFESVGKAMKLKNIILEIKPLSLKINCKDCGYAFETQKITFHCRKCLGTDIDIGKEKELIIDSIEIQDK